jgi:hypothetical protein
VGYGGDIMEILSVKENLRHVENVISKACDEAKRDRNDVTLVAVSKTKPVEMIKEAYDCGCRDFGENKVQEILDKYDFLPDDIRWHMIGHLQRNKVKYIVDKVYMIHSVDSYRLAEEISREAVKKDVDVKILIEVNVANEETKFGLDSDSVIDLVRKISVLPNVCIKGLMTVAPFVENAEENRQYFQKLRKLAVDIKAENIDNVDMGILSMGMTGDYPVAISEGATLVRVGTGIFGARYYATIKGKEM